MRIGIVGAGSIGSLFAGCLTSTPCDLLLYGRGLHAAHLTVDGLKISGAKEEEISSQRWEVLLEEQDMPDSVHSSCDIVLLTGKASAFEQHVEVAKHLLRQDGIICTLANGLGHEERLVLEFGAHRVLAATTTHGAPRPPGACSFFPSPLAPLRILPLLRLSASSCTATGPRRLGLDERMLLCCAGARRRTPCA